MKRTKRSSSEPLPNFEFGQVWQMGDSDLRIGLVGKRLVHYKHYNQQVKRPGVLLSNKDFLQKFLRQRGAVLLPPSLTPAAPVPEQATPRRKSVRSSEKKAK